MSHDEDGSVGELVPPEEEGEVGDDEGLDDDA
jgi:hypothetical protein